MEKSLSTHGVAPTRSMLRNYFQGFQCTSHGTGCNIFFFSLRIDGPIERLCLLFATVVWFRLYYVTNRRSLTVSSCCIVYRPTCLNALNQSPLSPSGLVGNHLCKSQSPRLPRGSIPWHLRVSLSLLFSLAQSS